MLKLWGAKAFLRFCWNLQHGLASCTGLGFSESLRLCFPCFFLSSFLSLLSSQMLSPLLSFFPSFATLPSVPISVPSSLHPFSPFHEFATAFFFVLTQSFHYLLLFLYPSTKWADCAFEMHGSPTFFFLLLTSHQRHEFSLTHLSVQERLWNLVESGAPTLGRDGNAVLLCTALAYLGKINLQWPGKMRQSSPVGLLDSVQNPAHLNRVGNCIGALCKQRTMPAGIFHTMLKGLGRFTNILGSIKGSLGLQH